MLQDITFAILFLQPPNSIKPEKRVWCSNEYLASYKTTLKYKSGFALTIVITLVYFGATIKHKENAHIYPKGIGRHWTFGTVLPILDKVLVKQSACRQILLCLNT